MRPVVTTVMWICDAFQSLSLFLSSASRRAGGDKLFSLKKKTEDGPLAARPYSKFRLLRWVAPRLVGLMVRAVPHFVAPAQPHRISRDTILLRFIFQAGETFKGGETMCVACREPGVLLYLYVCPVKAILLKLQGVRWLLYTERE